MEGHDGSVHQPGRQSSEGGEQGVCLRRGDFPVQNGKAEFPDVDRDAPAGVPRPQTVAFTDVTVTDETNGISGSFSGTF